METAIAVTAPLQLGVFVGPHPEKFEIPGSEKSILVDPGDEFSMDNEIKRRKPRNRHHHLQPMLTPVL